MTIFKRKILSSLGLFTVALLLRLQGLSHDLHHGMVYHPDSPKQMRAVQRFVNGDYYMAVGNPDYDGYPLFFSHLLEYLLRVHQAGAKFISGVTGHEHPPEQPDYLTLFWLARIVNALLSSAAVLLVLLLGRRFISPWFGIVAAALLAVSPVDITASHYATGDTSAAFFCLVGFYYASRILEHGRASDYLLAGLFSAIACSSKYHGALALAAGGVAHLFHVRGWQGFFTGQSLRKMVLLVTAFVIGFFLSSPALLIYPEGAFGDILDFLAHTSSFGMTAAMRAMNPFERFMTGMRENIPVLVAIVGWIPTAAALIAICRGRRAPFILLTALIPLLYILAALATKPLTHPVYHTMATPYISLLAAAGMAAFAAPGRGLIWRKVMVAAGVLVSALYMANYSLRELFFFNHNDTRYLARIWADENIPLDMPIMADRYTISTTERNDHFGPDAKPEFKVYAGNHAPMLSDGTFEVARFELEGRDKLSVFRNWKQTFYALDHSGLQPDAYRPFLMPFPSSHARNMYFEEAPWWIRNPLTFILSTHREASGTLTSTNALKWGAWLVRNGSEFSNLTLEFGGRTLQLQLAPGERQLLEVQNPNPRFMPGSTRYFYSWCAKAPYGLSQVTLITNPRDLAMAQFNIGNFTAAASSFAQKPMSIKAGGDQVVKALSEMVSGTSVPEGIAQITSQNPELLDSFGVSASYLDKLPSHTWGSSNWSHATVTNDVSGEFLYEEITLPAISLETGLYSLQVCAAIDGATVHVQDLLDRPLQASPFLPSAEEIGMTVARISAEHLDSFLLLKIRIPVRNDQLQIESLTLRPDHEATLKSYRHLMKAILNPETDFSGGCRLWYLPLLEYGRYLERQGLIDQARRLYRGAIRLAPHRKAAVEQLLALPGLRDSSDEELTRHYLATSEVRIIQPAFARFSNDTELHGYQLSKKKIRAGESFGIITHWTVPKLKRSVFHQAAWLHIIPEESQQASFQGDKALLAMLRAYRPGEDYIEPACQVVTIPMDTPPGIYRLKTGIWIPSQRKRTKIVQAEGEHDKRGFILDRIEILP